MSTIGNPFLWGGFIAFVLLMLALDLGVFHRKAKVVSFKDAGLWSLAWVSMALTFNALLWWKFGSGPALDFLTGYLIEKSLSVDNIFVFVLVFTSMRVPASDQHHVLFWGILSALILRAAMIFAGVALLERFHWLIYVFGGFLIFTGIKLFLQVRKGAEPHPEESRALALVRRFIPFTPKLHNHHFFAIENGRRLATPLFMALIVIEITDVVFALDSIPAIFAVTRDPFIVFTSNIFAILGLRSLFFLLSGAVERFHYLKVGLAAVLTFVGAKMVLAQWVHLPSWISLIVIATILAGSIAYSLWVSRNAPREGAEPLRRNSA